MAYIKPYLRWEIDLFTNYLGANPTAFMDVPILAAYQFALTMRLDITVNEARAMMRANGPHPDSCPFGGAQQLDRGNMFIWEDDVADPTDDDIPQSIKDAYGIP